MQLKDEEQFIGIIKFIFELPEFRLGYCSGGSEFSSSQGSSPSSISLVSKIKFEDILEKIEASKIFGNNLYLWFWCPLAKMEIGLVTKSNKYFMHVNIIEHEFLKYNSKRKHIQTIDESFYELFPSEIKMKILFNLDLFGGISCETHCKKPLMRFVPSKTSSV